MHFFDRIWRFSHHFLTVPFVVIPPLVPGCWIEKGKGMEGHLLAPFSRIGWSKRRESLSATATIIPPDLCSPLLLSFSPIYIQDDFSLDLYPLLLLLFLQGRIIRGSVGEPTCVWYRRQMGVRFRLSSYFSPICNTWFAACVRTINGGRENCEKIPTGLHCICNVEFFYFKVKG